MLCTLLAGVLVNTNSGRETITKRSQVCSWLLSLPILIMPTKPEFPGRISNGLSAEIRVRTTRVKQ